MQRSCIPHQGATGRRRRQRRPTTRLCRVASDGGQAVSRFPTFSTRLLKYGLLRIEPAGQIERRLKRDDRRELLVPHVCGWCNLVGNEIVGHPMAEASFIAFGKAKVHGVLLGCGATSRADRQGEFDAKHSAE